jgi:cysteine desulfurase / selenocysteine lyase
MIYLDNAATSFPKPESVYAAMDRCARTQLANPGRAGHKMALAAERILDDGRHRLNQFFHGAAPERFIFTLNGTDALNIAFKGVLNPGDHVVTTDLEHNSVSRPLRALELAGTITLTRVKADAGGTIDPAAIRSALKAKTKLVALTHASNVLGAVQPIGDIGRLVREHGALFLVDAAPDTNRCSGRLAPAPCTSASAPSCVPGAKAAPAAIHPARRSRGRCPTFSKAARPMCWASLA